jgi:TetR/AcrR family transcriptional regulator, tetracycline repressor protein
LHIRLGGIMSQRKPSSSKVLPAPGRALSREAIARTALNLIDRDGLDAFSLRSLAGELGVYPTAIYWYLPNRNAILAEVTAQLVAGVCPPRNLPWRDFIAQLIRNVRTALFRHPNAVPLLGAQLVANTATDLSLVEGLLVALTEAGFAEERLRDAYNATCAALVGFTVQELCPAPEERQEWQEALEARLDTIDPAAYPLLHRHLPLLGGQAFMLRWTSGSERPLDGGFNLFLDIFLSGLEVMARR